MNTSASNAIGPAALDRLVDGELDDASRAALLRDLDREPGGWKRCALAFLEAQAWRESMAARPMPLPARSPPSLRPGAMVRQVLAVAAVVAVAFCAGFVSRGTDTSHPYERAGGQYSARPAAAPPLAARGDDAASPVPEYVRTRMERQGYRVEGGRKLINVALEDGRRVAVPVDSVSYRYVGQRIH